MYRGFLLSLKEEIENYPNEVFKTPVSAGSIEVSTIPSPPASGAVFIVHGHDELNLLRLKELLKDRWKLEPIVLQSQPGKGRTLIEKFEEEAQRVAFALALFSPDDFVAKPGDMYGQARPNVAFELGWFYGRLGRERVCILFKKGTKIHSDLDGISRIEFSESVSEKVVEIERELLSLGILRM